MTRRGQSLTEGNRTVTAASLRPAHSRRPLIPVPELRRQPAWPGRRAGSRPAVRSGGRRSCAGAVASPGCASPSRQPLWRPRSRPEQEGRHRHREHQQRGHQQRGHQQSPALNRSRVWKWAAETARTWGPVWRRTALPDRHDQDGPTPCRRDNASRRSAARRGVRGALQQRNPRRCASDSQPEAQLRRTVLRGPCGGEPRGWHGPRGCASAGGTRGSWHGACCWAGTSACSPDDSRSDRAGPCRGWPCECMPPTTPASIGRPRSARGHAKPGRRQAPPRYGRPRWRVKPAGRCCRAQLTVTRSPRQSCRDRHDKVADEAAAIATAKLPRPARRSHRDRLNPQRDDALPRQRGIVRPSPDGHTQAMVLPTDCRAGADTPELVDRFARSARSGCRDLTGAGTAAAGHSTMQTRAPDTDQRHPPVCTCCG